MGRLHGAKVQRWRGGCVALAGCSCASAARADAPAAQRTASDELYHAVWANAVGVRRVSSPVAGQLLAVNEALSPSQLDETTWLARLRVRRSAWDAATNAWRAEAERQRTEHR